MTVRDFTQVFDVYSQFEESMIQAKMEAVGENGPSEEGSWHFTIVHIVLCALTLS